MWHDRQSSAGAMSLLPFQPKSVPIYSPSWVEKSKWDQSALPKDTTCSPHGVLTHILGIMSMELFHWATHKSSKGVLLIRLTALTPLHAAKSMNLHEQSSRNVDMFKSIHTQKSQVFAFILYKSLTFSISKIILFSRKKHFMIAIQFVTFKNLGTWDTIFKQKTNKKINTYTGVGQYLGGFILSPLVTNCITSWLLIPG